MAAETSADAKRLAEASAHMPGPARRPRRSSRGAGSPSEGMLVPECAQRTPLTHLCPECAGSPQALGRMVEAGTLSESDSQRYMNKLQTLSRLRVASKRRQEAEQIKAVQLQVRKQARWAPSGPSRSRLVRPSNLWFGNRILTHRRRTAACPPSSAEEAGGGAGPCRQGSNRGLRVHPPAERGARRCRF